MLMLTEMYISELLEKKNQLKKRKDKTIAKIFQKLTYTCISSITIVDATFWIESPNDKTSCMFFSARGVHTMRGCSAQMNVVCVKDAKSLCK